MSHSLDDRQRDRLHELFVRAVELEENERAAFCARECGDDAPLRDKLEAMLASLQGDDEEFLAQPVLSSAAITDLDELAELDAQAPALPDPERIGPYRIVERIGEGGMGVVYLAEQEEPVRRRVALKVIRPGMDTERVIARFSAERQALARMDHPGIARIHDSGATAEGRPWFAMELVEGQPLHVYNRERRLPTRARLELFCELADAIQHAHQKGVIHRDLKPSNVLVAEHDGRPRAVVIDFGIARAVTEPLTDHTHLTRAHETIGTLDYMAPEQADGNAADVDSRTDIYSLGVMLFEQLAGELPFDRSTPIGARTPHPPSTRIGRTDATTAAAAQQSTDVRALKRTLRGELDWITMKALAPDRERRYASASELGADVRRFLAGEPVLAAPPSAWYRWRTFARRYRTQVIAAGVTALAILGGSVAAVLGMLEARAQADLAATRQQRTDRVADLVIDWVSRINRENGVFDRRAFLDSTVQDLDADNPFAELPRREATVRKVLGEAYASIGAHEDALEQLGRALRLRDEERDRGDEIRAPDLELHEIVWLQIWPSHMSGGGNVWRALVQRSFFTLIDLFADKHPEIVSAILRLQAAADLSEYRTRSQELIQVAERGLEGEPSLWLALGDYFCLRDFRGWGNWVDCDGPWSKGLSEQRTEPELAPGWHPAIECYQGKLGLPPSNSRILLVHSLRLRVLAQHGDPAVACKFAEEQKGLLSDVLTADHAYAVVFEYCHGKSLCRAGDVDGGIERMKAAYDDFFEIDRSRFIYCYFVAASIMAQLQKSGDETAAGAWRARILELLVHSNAGMLTPAQAAIAFPPEGEAVRYVRGLEDLAAEDFDEKVQEFRETFEMPSHSAVVAAGVFCTMIGRNIADLPEVVPNWTRNPEAALAAMELCVQASSGMVGAIHPQALHRLARVQLGCNQPDAALGTVERLVEFASTDRPREVFAVPEMELATALYEKGRALAELRRPGAEASLLEGYRLWSSEVGPASFLAGWQFEDLHTFYTDRDDHGAALQLATDRLRTLLRTSGGVAALLPTARAIVSSPVADAVSLELAVVAARKVKRLDPDHPVAVELLETARAALGR